MGHRGQRAAVRVSTTLDDIDAHAAQSSNQLLNDLVKFNKATNQQAAAPGNVGFECEQFAGGLTALSDTPQMAKGRGFRQVSPNQSAVAITAGVQAKAGTEGATAGASAGPATGIQAPTTYRKGMAVFVHAKGGLMYEATVGGQKLSYTPGQ